MNKSETIASLSKSLSALQGELHDGIRDSKGGHGKYADLAQLLQIIRPLLCKHKLSFTQHPSVEAEHVHLTSLLIHESGEWVESTLLLKIPPARGANESQAVGSGITYARRYALSSIFGISQEDDDGQYKRAEANHQTRAKPLPDKPAPNAKPELGQIELNCLNMIIQGYMAGKYPEEILRTMDDNMKKNVAHHLDAKIKQWLKEAKQ